MAKALPHLLVVDDAKPIRSLVEQALAPYACTVETATNGFNALFAMEKALPALILLDVNMPVMDGVEFLTMIRSKPELADIPVLMLVSPADHRIRPTLDELGIAGALVKPVQAAALVEAINAILPLKPAKPAAPGGTR